MVLRGSSRYVSVTAVPSATLFYLPHKFFQSVWTYVEGDVLVFFFAGDRK